MVKGKVEENQRRWTRKEGRGLGYPWGDLPPALISGPWRLLGLIGFSRLEFGLDRPRLSFGVSCLGRAYGL